ncbi:Exosome complex component RRP45, partial [Spiromyces aspiralis]
MVQDQGVSNNNQQFLLQAIEAGIRTDGRGIYDYRTLDIKCEDTPGTVQVHLGDTKVIAKISCLVARPFPDRPSEGIITYNTEISALASPSFDTN